MNGKMISESACGGFSCVVSSAWVWCALVFAGAALAGPSAGAELIAHWKFEANAADSVGTHHGKLVNAPAFTTGKVGQALRLNGTGNYVQINGLLGNPANLTLSAWVKLNTLTNSNTIISLGDYAAIDINATRISGVFYNGSGWTNTSIDVADLYAYGVGSAVDSWHHVVYVFKDTGDAHRRRQRLYLDGIQLASSADTRPISYSGLAPGTFIGRRGNLASNYVGGLIDEVRVYNSPLAAQEVWELYKAEKYGGRTPMKAFPTAEGYGANSRGGRGGRVIEVTNLKDSGPGSFRDAISQTGPRIIVFRVGGTINLESTLQINEPYVTVAGQTAPGGGIQLKNHSVYSRTHDVIFRHMRFRPGLDRVDLEKYGRDTNAIIAGGGRRVGEAIVPGYNVIIDHCDAMWSTDQNADAYGAVYDVTYQWCIIAEGTTIGHSVSPGGDKGPTVSHSTGTLVGNEPWYGVVQTVAIHHSLYAHNAGRNPLAGGYGGWSTLDRNAMATPGIRLDFRNNVVYNWAGNNYAQFANSFFRLSEYQNFLQKSAGKAATEVNFVGNHYIRGPNSSSNDANIVWLSNFVKMYAEDNISPRGAEPCSGFDIGVNHTDNKYFGGPSKHHYYGTYDTIPFVAKVPFDTAPVTTSPVEQIYELVLNNVGATKPMRDAVDTRIVNEVRTRSGFIGNRLDYPTLANGTPPADSDHDGMPDSWESAHGLRANDPTDGPAIAPNAYSNVENYLNELAGDPVDYRARPAAWGDAKVK